VATFGAQSCTTCAIASGRPPRSRKSGSLRSVPDLAPPGLSEIIDQFCRRYPNAKTALDYRSSLRCLFRHAGVNHPAHLTEADLLGYCTAGNPANNTVYQRTTKVLTFLRWCEREGLIQQNPGARLRDSDSPLRTYRRTYGKVQAQNPGRWLTHDEAFGQLIGACQDATEVGLRDEVAIRLGLTGLRVHRDRQPAHRRSPPGTDAHLILSFNWVQGVARTSREGDRDEHCG
jgi:hypothetical protein